jgi:hypothetical protein
MLNAGQNDLESLMSPASFSPSLTLLIVIFCGMSGQDAVQCGIVRIRTTANQMTQRGRVRACAEAQP